MNEALPGLLARVMANEMDRVCLVGTGTSNQPTGLAAMSGGTNEVSMGTDGAAITNYDEILDLIRLIQEDNADDPTVAIMAPRTANTIAKFADTTNQPLRRPPALDGVRFVTTSQVPIDQTQGTSSDASSVYVGGFSDLWIGIRPEQVRIEVLKELFAENLQYAFLVHARWDVQAQHEQSLGRLTGIIP